MLGQRVMEKIMDGSTFTGLYTKSVNYKSNPIRTSFGSLVIATLLLASWALNQGMGDRSALLIHIFYLPILLGGFFFGIQGGVLAGLAAGILCNGHFAIETIGGLGPLQTAWLPQVGIFLFIGTLAGSMCEMLRRQAASLVKRDDLNLITGHPNLLALERDLGRHILSEKKSNIPGLLVIEIGLACVDEMIATFGRAKADAILRSIGDCLQKQLPFAGKIYHTHTDHFGLLASETDVKDIDAFTSLLIHEIKKPIELAGLPVSASACVGIARYPADGENAAELTRAARFALRMAELTNQTFVIFDKTHDAQYRESLQRLTELRTAINNNELIFHYQPKLDLRSGRVSAVEALIRWPHPSGRLLNPSEFLPLIENTSLITQLSTWGLRTAIAQIATWQKEGININLGIAVNLSAMDLQSGGVVQTLQELLTMHDVDPGRLEIEVTETTIIDDIDIATDCLSKIKNLGVQVAIDDFGTGHAGLVQLRDLPVNALKIDQVFVARILDQKKDELIVRSAIDLGHSFGLDVVAEGVESAKIMELLRTYGCDIVQGYGIAKPMAEADLRKWLQTRAQESSLLDEVHLA